MAQPQEIREMSNAELYDEYQDAKEHGPMIRLEELQREIAGRWEDNQYTKKRCTISFEEDCPDEFRTLVIDTLVQSEFIIVETQHGTRNLTIKEDF